jgi:dUTP pyrophosphatase
VHHVLELKVLDARFGGEWPMPAYATAASAGLDLRAALDATLVLQPGDTALVPIGPGDPSRRSEPVRGDPAALGTGP